ncbi:MAG: SDR family NAD(P)-dependent oxidoreductase [Halieaceae bacterium]|jgi:short-subunit dehydrogenase|nr:SDR family NAD(P)-dependent oxidoreductase [Halieaceae bacterium]
MKNLKGRVAVITGAGSGIGRATSIALAERGCAIALVDIDPKGLEESVALVRATGVDASTHLADVADKIRMQCLPEEVIAEHGHVHILINNAGVSIAQKFEDQSIEDIEWIVGINLWGVIYGCKYFLPYLKREDEGHIVNLSSMFGIAAVAGQGSYSATKFAVRGLSEALYAELSSASIGVSSIHPGTIKTRIIQSGRGLSDAKKADIQRKFNKVGISPHRVAKKIVVAIERNQLCVRVSAETYILDWLKRFFPVSFHRFIAFFERRHQ